MNKYQTVLKQHVNSTQGCSVTEAQVCVLVFECLCLCVIPHMKLHCVKVSALLCPARSHLLHVPADILLPPSCYSQLENGREQGALYGRQQSGKKKTMDER